MPLTLHEHQRAGVEQMHNGCVLCGGVGSGKTHASLGYYVEKVCGGSLDRMTPMATPMDILVITPAMKRDSHDWEDTALQFGIFADPDHSYGGVSITVDSWQNINKWKYVSNMFIIFDEQKASGSGVWSKAFLEMVKRNPYVVLSATPADVWIDYVPLFIAHGFIRNRTEFMDNHVVYSFHGSYRKIKGYYGVRHLRAWRDQILVEMPYDRHTTRHLEAVPVEFDKDMFERVWKRRWHIYEDRPLIDAAEMHRVARKLVNSHPSRLDQIEKLAKKHPRLIIGYNFDYELDELRTLMTRLDIPYAEWNGHRHEPIPDTERWLYVVQYTAAAEAWNCITTDAMVYYSLNYSHKIFEQFQGRIDRLDTEFEDLYYYILISDARIDAVIWKSLVAKKNFHEGRNTKFKQEAA